jgi:hypothetical protein
MRLSPAQFEYEEILTIHLAFSLAILVGESF